MKIIAFLLIVSISFFETRTQGIWELVKNEKGIKVFVKEVSGSEYYAFKATMTVRTTENKIVKTLTNVGDFPEWFAFISSAKLIHQSVNDQFFFMETDYPWPYANEGMNYQMKFIKMEKNKQKVIISGSNNNLNCKHSLKKANGYILLETVAENVKITYYFHSEPSQSISPWLINPVIHKMPYQTFLALKKRLLK